MRQLFGIHIQPLNTLQRTLNKGKRGTKLMRNIGKKHQLVFSQLFFNLYFIVQTVEVTSNAESKVGNGNQQNSINKKGPRGKIKRRINHYVQSSYIFIPDTRTVARSHLKFVLAVRQLFISSKVQ